jgi:hypothetical protein
MSEVLLFIADGLFRLKISEMSFLDNLHLVEYNLLAEVALTPFIVKFVYNFILEGLEG